METMENKVLDIQDLFKKFLELTDKKFIRNGIDEDDRYYQYYRQKLISLISDIDIDEIIDDRFNERLEKEIEEICKECEWNNICENCTHVFEEYG